MWFLLSAVASAECTRPTISILGIPSRFELLSKHTQLSLRTTATSVVLTYVADPSHRYHVQIPDDTRLRQPSFGGSCHPALRRMILGMPNIVH